MEKTKARIEILCIIALLVIMLPSADYLAKKAFAQGVEITIITPTGGNLGATSDCNDITSANGIIWHACNGLLYAIDRSTNTVLANTTITITTADTLTASVVGTSVFHTDVSANKIDKYTLSGSVITLTGSFTNGSCSFPDTPIVQYDYLGFLWIGCDVEDRIIRINPNTMTTTVISQDLTDAVGIDCDLPIEVVYDGGDNIGIISCGTTNTIVSFRVDSPTSITLLDSETLAGSNIFIDSGSNRIMKQLTTTITPYTYDSNGLLTIETVITVNTDQCYNEPISTTSNRLVCIDETGVNTAITGYVSNSTGFFQILNVISAFNDPVRVGMDLGQEDNFGTFYVSSDLNNQRYIEIAGLREISLTPTPPDGSEPPNIIGGVDCNNPANENKLICRVTDPIGGAGNFVIGNGTSGLTGIGCSTGLVDCESDTNPRTNGLGLLIFVGSIFVIVGMFYITIGRDAFTIPIYIWIVIILALSAFFTITGLIDPVFLILTVVALIALAAPKLQNIIRGGNTMGGGSSA